MATGGTESTNEVCDAYENLVKQIGSQCESYRRLHKEGDLGCAPKMYQEEGYGKIPAEGGAATFLRGGIITSMACFEAFVQTLLPEAQEKLEKGSAPNDGYTFSSLLYAWYEKYDKKLCGINDSFNMKRALDLTNHPMTYYYLLDERYVSRIEIKNENIICLFLRLFHGLRCIMAHGNSKETLDKKALKEFPTCHVPLYIPKCPACSDGRQVYGEQGDLKDILQLNKTFEMIDKDLVREKARKFPRTDVVEHAVTAKWITDKQKNDCKLLINEHFKDVDAIDKVKNPSTEFSQTILQNHVGLKDGILDEKYAFFHILRIHHWLKESGRKAYVTYHMLVRVNQFILLLAHRMMVAVARMILKKNDTLTSIWGMQRDTADLEWKQEIEKFEESCKKKVQSLKKSPSQDNEAIN